MNYIRLDKYLSENKIFSRREAKHAIENSLVLINGKTAENAGQKINPELDKITTQKNSANKTTVLVYKPRGYVSSKDTNTKNIFDAFPLFKNLNTVGRLDRDSEGLILLSNDGIITKAVTGKEHHIEKEYIVTTREDVLPYMIDKMMAGLKLNDGIATAVNAKKIKSKAFSITIKDGRKHQVRRMANALKLTVESLTRVRIGSIKVGKMKAGQFRKLKKEEITELKSVL